MKNKSSCVIKGNVRFSGTLDSLHVNVWFRSISELQRLIYSLVELRDSANDQNEHVHLQHYDLSADKQMGLAEVNFFRPGREMTDLEKELTDTVLFHRIWHKIHTKLSCTSHYLI